LLQQAGYDLAHELIQLLAVALRFNQQSEGIQELNLYIVTPLFEPVSQLERVICNNKLVEFWSSQNY
jgi:hypothetical protein